ncbi:MAG: pentapeptide repeat-containing protein [Gammaproteobacteria bacterium]
MTKPRICDDPLFVLLRTGEVAKFNASIAAGASCDLTGSNLSRTDLRGLVADGLDFSDCYFRMSDLRGVDFRNAKLEGASFADANISGTYFPKEISPEEINIALAHGTRVRYR